MYKCILLNFTLQYILLHDYIGRLNVTSVIERIVRKPYLAFNEIDLARRFSPQHRNPITRTCFFLSEDDDVVGRRGYGGGGMKARG